MQSPKLATIAGSCVALIGTAATAQEAELLNDERYVEIEVFGTGPVEQFTLDSRSEAAFGQPFDVSLEQANQSPAGGFDYDVLAGQDTSIDFPAANRFEINGRLDGSGMGARTAGTDVLDVGFARGESSLDLLLNTDMPVDYEIELFMDVTSDGFAQFSAFDEEHTIPLDFTPGTTQTFSGRADAGDHEITALAIGTFQTETLEPGSDAVVEFAISGHVVPSPAAVGPGLLLLGGLLMRRQRRSAAA